MYYSSGNYEAFARPKKPVGVDRKSAYLVGTGLAALTAACYLVRDGQMKGEHIHLFEKGSIPGGACDGCQYPGIGYVMRGGREMDDHFEVMWDLFRSIPSLETEGASVLDEYYWLNKADPNYSLCRATENRGQNAHTDGKFGLSDQGCMELIKLFFTPDEQLYDKRITDVFDAEVFSSNFWLYWRTMFAFENWHSALEMKLYLKRYIHHVGGLPDLRALRFTRYNQYESMILPMIRYLEGHGVRFHYNTKVTNIEFELTGGKKQARSICLLVDDEAERVDLTENDLVFITNGGCVESTSIGSQDQPAVFNPTLRPGNGWDLWKKIAAQDEAFGRPEKFCSDPEQTNWMSATVTTLDERIVPYIQNICQRDPFSGRTVTPARGLDLWPVQQHARRLHQKAHAGLHRQGDLHGVAVSSGSPRKPDRGPGGAQCQYRARNDALYHSFLHAPHRRRPPGGGAGGRSELCLHRPICRDEAGYHLHHRVFHAHRHGSRVHPAGYRPGRAGGLGQHLRCPRPAERRCSAAGWQTPE